MMEYILSLFKKAVKLELSNRSRWVIFFYAVGIVCGLSCNYKLELFLYAIIGCVLLCYISAWNRFLMALLLFFLFGFGLGLNKNRITIKLDQPIPYRALQNITITGTIASIKLTESKTFLVISNINSSVKDLTKGSVRVFVTDHELVKTLYLGQNVKVRARLWQNRGELFPGDTSYVNYAKYNNILASGKVIELQPLDTTPAANFFTIKVDQLRRHIQQQIYLSGKRSAGAGVVVALLTGNTGFISKHDIEAVRRSGCAHILAISGLHMSIITAICFSMVLRILAFFPSIYLHYNTKKIAAIPTIFVCLFYILISGMPVSAVRSFLMCLCGFLGIIFDRFQSSMNILLFTFFIITLFNPEYILSPSFQMSFIAVLSLIAAYGSNINNLFGIKNKYLKYLFGILFSSFAATFATAFYEIYHFKQYAWIGLVSNIFVIPLTEFMTLPVAFIGMCLHGVPLASSLLYTMSSICGDIIIFICHFCLKLPHSFLLVQQMSVHYITIISLCLVLLFIMKSWLRFVTIPVLFITILCYCFSPKPDLVMINLHNNQNIFIQDNGRYYAVNKIENSYVGSVISQNLGVSEIYSIDQNEELKKKIQTQVNNIILYRIRNDELVSFQKMTGKIVMSHTLNGVTRVQHTINREYVCTFTFHNKQLKCTSVH